MGDPCYTSSDEAQKIQERTDIRLRVVGHRMDQTEIVSVCGGGGEGEGG